jgi:hypothetical protein
MASAATFLLAIQIGLADSDNRALSAPDLRQFGLTNLFGYKQTPVVPLLPPRSGMKSRSPVVTNLFGALTNFTLPFLAGTNLVLSVPNLKWPQPGVYKTEPYACIVVVPEFHPDERMIIGGNKEIESAMPIIKPETRLIPFRAGR